MPNTRPSNTLRPRTLGSGPVKVMMLHGWMASSAMFDALTRRLDPAHFTCALLDSRGYGLRRDEPGDCSIEAAALDVHAAADRLGWPTMHLIGHSMGGMHAQFVSLLAPDRVTTQILLAPVPPRGATLSAPRLAAKQTAIDDYTQRRAAIAANAGGLDEQSVDELAEASWQSVSRPAMRQHLHAWNGTNFTQLLLSSAIPTLVLAGSRDPAAPESTIRADVLPCYQQAQLAILPGAGHYLSIERPDEVAAHVRRFTHINARKRRTPLPAHTPACAPPVRLMHAAGRDQS